jgi:hypothetical protein
MKLVSILLVMAFATQASAQSIRGTITDAETRTPVPGVLLTVRDSTRAIRSRVLTDQNGAFRVALAAGNYQLTAEHIAFSPMTQAVRVDDSTAPVALALKPAPIALSEIVVRTERQCRTAEDPGASRLWYLARTALGAVSAETTKEFRLRHFRRVLDLQFNQVGDEAMRFELQRGSHSFRSVPDSLLRRGFVQDREGMLAFYGPDAEVLLSDEFVNSHCFEVTRSRDKPGLVGLAFGPHNERGKPDIRGAMWVDQTTGQLQYVEYEFTGLTHLTDKRFARGRVEFEMLPDKSWIVRRWYIRMPNFVQTAGLGRVSTVLGGAVEEGGEVLSMSTGANTTATGSIRGLVYDSLSGRPLANASVYLSGTSHATTADGSGAFQLEGVPAGEHFVTFHAERMVSLPRFNNSQRVSVGPDSAAYVTLTIPTERTLMSAHCTSDDLFEAARGVEYGMNRLGALTGAVRENGRAVPGARINVTWGQRTGWTETRADGGFTLCGYPADAAFTLSVFVQREERFRQHFDSLDSRLRRIEINLPGR